MRGLYDWHTIDSEDFSERLDFSRCVSRESRPNTGGGKRGSRPSQSSETAQVISTPCEWKTPPITASDWNDLDTTEIALEDCFRGRENAYPVDRAMMIEAASRHILRRDDSRGSTAFRRKDKGSSSTIGGGSGGGQASPHPTSGSHQAFGRMGPPHASTTSVPDEDRRGGIGGVTGSQDRRCYQPQDQFQSSIIPADSGLFPEQVGSSSREFADLSNAFFGSENSEDYKHLKRPPSRKKNPSQSAVAGLGAFCSPILQNAFEKSKTIRPPYDPMGYNRRPPSRHKEPPKSLHLEGDPKEKPISSGQDAWASGVSRRPPSGEGANRWACARTTDASRRRASGSENRPDRSENRPDRSENRPDLGIFGQSHNRPDDDRGSKPNAFKPADEGTPAPIPWQAATTTAWTREEKEPLEVNGTAFCARPMTHIGSLWPSAPRMQVEDVEDIPDSSMKNISYKPKAFDTRQKCRSVPFDTKLEADFLNLFAS